MSNPNPTFKRIALELKRKAEEIEDNDITLFKIFRMLEDVRDSLPYGKEKDLLMDAIQILADL